MICTFCGTENREENRFCGMCGVRLERRKAERRMKATGGATMECGSCGHQNEPGYKFCGMCGQRIDRRTLERRGAPDKAVRATAMANAQLPSPESRRAAAGRESQSARTQAATLVAPDLPEHPLPANQSPPSTSVSGPSFLGLNDASPQGDYLLEEAKPSGRGLRTLLLIVVLAAIAGLILVQYRANLKASPKSPELPKPEPAGLPQSHGSKQPLDNLKTLATAAGAAGVKAAAAAASRASPPDADAEDKTTADQKTQTKKDKTPAERAVSEKSEKKVREKASSRQDAEDDADTASDSAASTQNKPSAALVKAQRYLHGQGVRQNCEQGLVYLKAATRENDPGAAVQMAALYASGFCVRQDRVKAYQWFVTAREMQPENRWIGKNLDQLWAQMTPQERREIR